MDTLIKKLRTENVFLSINGENLEVHFDGDGLPAELIQDLRDNKQALIQYIKDNQLTNDYINIEPLPAQDAYLLSSSQKRSWILSQLGGNAAYNMTVTLVFDGKLQHQTLENAFDALIERHEILRTVFKEGEEEVMQYILPMEKHRFRVTHWDLRMDTEKKEKTDILVQKATTTSFDLEKGPLFGVNLIQLTEEKHVITLVMHHIIGDDWSTSVFIKELMLFYNAFVAEKSNPLPPLKFNYKDYAAWQRAALDKKHRDQHQAYWLEKFAGTIPVLDMPTDKPRPSVRTYEGGELETWIPKALAQDFKKLVEGAGGTFFMGLLSLVKGLLYLYSRQKDIVVGSVTAGRVHADLENQIGFYVNTLAFRTQFSEEDSYLELLAKVRTVTLETFEHQVYPFDELVNDLKLERNLGRNPLFDAFVIMHNNQDIQKPGETDNLAGIEVSLYGEETTVVSWFDVLFDFLEVDGAIRVNLGYNTDILSKATAIQLGEHFEQLMRAVTEAPNRAINELDYLSSSERKKLLEEFNDTTTVIPENQFVLDLLRKQVVEQADALAISFGDESLTYADLDEKSNQLAQYLLEQEEIPKNALIAVCMHRSIDLLITLWGILKSGNTYVPIDPNYPTERILYILEDAQVEFVLCDKATTSMVTAESETRTICAVEKIWEVMQSVQTTAPTITIEADQLAYVIYTSGSTGKPKGVMVTHGNLRAFLHWGLAEFEPYDFDVVFAGTSICFDLSVFEIFFTASIGKRIRLLEDGLAAADYLGREKSILLNTVPSVMKALLEQAVDLTQVKAINLGGESIPNFVRDQLDLKRITVRNLYGPTEDTIYSTVCYLQEKEPIRIGKPIANTSVYIVDKQLNLLPRGAKGELCLSGAGVAKGYLHRPDLTAQRFVDHPFDPQSKYKLYRTGDLARWLPDGQLDFLGRIDTQVKIRGYRVELGEIETLLQASPMIKEAVVLAKEDAQANKRLIAYLVTTVEYEKTKLQSFLKAKLPVYMLPSIFVKLAKLPLTPNGKRDRAALPDPIVSELSTQAYVAPRTALESDLVETWQQLLRLEKVGIDDNFFELGGDSIISIQLVSRINRKGFQLVPIDLFENQTVADLADFIISNQSNQIIAEQGLLSGSLNLLPIQKWFLEQEATSYHHFNQTVLLTIDKTISSFQLGEVFTGVLAHHDILRACFTNSEEGWTQVYGNQENSLVVADLSTINDQDTLALSKAIEAIGNQHQASLHLSKGEVIRMVLIKTPTTTAKNRLLIVAHHLVVDGVSWRILLEDIDRSLQTLVDTNTLSFGEKTSSYRQWGTALEAYSTNPRIEAQLPFWEKATRKQSTLPVDHDSPHKITRGSLKHHANQLGARDTTALLSKAQKAYQLEINDLLLAALIKTLSDWSANASVTIGLEGHGREHLFAGINTSNTIGWFTTLFPVVFTAPQNNTLADYIKAVKEELRAIPDKGIAYGMLRYLHPDSAIRAQLETCDWEVIFNYLGQFDNLLDGANYLGIAGEPAGKQADDNLPFDAKFEINASVVAGKLSVNWTYSTEVYEAETVADLAAKYLGNLKVIIEHCETQKLPQPTPTDFGLAPEVSYQALDQFLAKHNDEFAPIADMARLSPLQQGMLFHHLYDAKDTAYLEQFIFHIDNGFSLPAFEATWEYLLAQYSVLRTAVFGEALNIPVQCVYENLALPIEILDFSTFSTEQIETKWERFVAEERAKGIDFERPPLMRILLVKTGVEQYRMLWLFHHILLDGWSLPILMEAFLTTYEAFYQGASLEQVKQQFNRKPDNYLAYIHYLNQQDKFAEETFWKSYLGGFLQPSLLPFVDTTVDRNKGGTQEEMKLVFSSEVTANIQKYAQRNHLTVNTLVQGVWAFLLSKYTGKEEIVYGVTVSGRPESLSGVEEKIGLFINTIPLRVKCTANQNIATILTELQKEHATARMYQYTALTDIQRWNALTGDLFDTLIAFENYPLGEVVDKEWALKFTHFELQEKTNYLLSLTVSLAETLNVNFGYKVDLLRTDLVEEIKHHFELVICQIIAADELNLANINLLSPTKKSLILETFNQTQNTYPKDKTIPHLFQAQVQLHPDKAALIFQAEKMSYRALDEQSNQLAAYLIAQGVTAQEKVGVLARRGFEMIVSVLAILKCRAIYVPLNIDYPEARLVYILKDAGVGRIICGEDAHWEDCGLPQENYQRILPAQSATYPVTPIEYTTAATSKALSAYVMYTSGTTGQPKGIVVNHQNIVKLSFDEGPIQVYPEDKVLQWSNLSFDGSSYEIFAALLRGATLCLITESVAKDPADLAKLMKREAVSVCFLTTALFNAFVDYDLQSLTSLRILLFGGERSAIAPIQKALNVLGTDRLINVYGPTETTTFATYYPIHNCKHHSVPIGRPLMNTQVYILKENLAPVGIGLIGEICISGDGVAQGYLGKEALTAEKFIENPFEKGKENKLYKTGDLGYWLPDGNIIFVGRRDAQVKIRGYRIELSEIETKLQALPIVNQAVVIVNQDVLGNKRLVAYLVTPHNFKQEEITTALKAELPSYMIPAHFVALEKLPLTENGKLDKKALPIPNFSELQNETYVAPRNTIEEDLATIWQKTLGIAKIGIHDNFFELGGDSIVSIQVVSRIKRRNYVAKTRDLFEYPTIAGLAEHLASKTAEEQNEAEQGVLIGNVKLLPIQHWFLAKEYAARNHFNQDYLFEINKAILPEQLDTAFKAIVKQHDALRFQYQKGTMGWEQSYGTYEPYLDILDCSTHAPNTLKEIIGKHCQQVQESLSLERGELIRCVLLKMPAEVENHRLFITIHHLAVDGVSWRILLDQLEVAITTLQSGKELDLGPKSSSYRQWANHLAAQSTEERMRSEFSYWESVGEAYQELPVGIGVADTLVPEMKVCS
ncbi:MAG: amino acid adenylation domain-containing protein, partial [Saprospiraceae bacterium]